MWQIGSQEPKCRNYSQVTASDNYDDHIFLNSVDDFKFKTVYLKLVYIQALRALSLHY